MNERKDKTGCVVTGLGLALLATCALSVLVVYSTTRLARDQFTEDGMKVRLFERADTSAEVTETRRFRVGEPAGLVVASDAGDVTVTADDVSDIRVQMTRVGWGGTEAEALSAAEALTVTAEQNGDTVELTFTRPSQASVFGNRGGYDSVRFAITVPLRTRVEVGTGFGDVRLAGTRESAEMSSTFGDATVEDHDGPLVVRSESGDLTLARIDAGTGAVDARATFGDVNVDDVEGGGVTINSTSGEITVTRLHAENDVTVDADFGDIALADVRADDLTVSSGSGAVDFEEGRVAGVLEVTARFGDVTLGAVDADQTIVDSNSGGVTVSGAGGPVQLSTEFGDVDVKDGVDVVLSIDGGSGAVRFTGSLDGDRPHTIETSFGDIFLTIPTDSAFDVRLETGFGRIHSDLPITTSGEMDSGLWLGSLGGGGPLLTVTTNNGDISILSID